MEVAVDPVLGAGGWPAGGVFEALLAPGVVAWTMSLSALRPSPRIALIRYRSEVPAGAAASVYEVALIRSGVRRSKGATPIARCTT
jgi:hypothetical protein